MSSLGPFSPLGRSGGTETWERAYGAEQETGLLEVNVSSCVFTVSFSGHSTELATWSYSISHSNYETQLINPKSQLLTKKDLFIANKSSWMSNKTLFEILEAQHYLHFPLHWFIHLSTCLNSFKLLVGTFWSWLFSALVLACFSPYLLVLLAWLFSPL